MLVIVFLLYAFLPSYCNKQKFFKKDKPQKQEIYLTFDDGPSTYTDELLDVLKKYKVKATFFCVANFAKQHKGTIERMKQEGHVIALHSLKHKNAMLQGVLETKNDLEKSLRIMQELGVSIQYYRPPWGDANFYLLKRLKQKNIKCILWNVMAQDWEANTTPDIITNKLLTRTKPGDIICLHDGRGKNEAPRKTILALERVIPTLIEKGFQFKTINEYEN